MAIAGSRILVLSTDPITERMPGPAIRAWHLAEVLSAEHEVVLASTVAATRNHPGMEVRQVEPGPELVALGRWMDILVAPPGVLYLWPQLATSDRALVFDAYGPYHLEHLEPSSAAQPIPERAAELSRFTGALLEHLGCADFVLCASERQRDYWTGALTALGRVNPLTYDDDPSLRRLIDVVPFGMPAEPPRAGGRPLRERGAGLGPGDEIVLWAGGIYNWLDPVAAVRAVGSLAAHRPRLRLVFLGGGHPNPAIPGMRTAVEARSVSDAAGLTGRHVLFNDGWVPYDERASWLLGADVGISTHQDHVETRYSFRTRVLDHLWAGLPSVLTAGDVLSDLVSEHGLGVAVPAGDPEAVAAAIEALLDAPRPGSDEFEPVRGMLRWPVVAAPLVAWCRNPAKAADRSGR